MYTFISQSTSLNTVMHNRKLPIKSSTIVWTAKKSQSVHFILGASSFYFHLHCFILTFTKNPVTVDLIHFMILLLLSPRLFMSNFHLNFHILAVTSGLPILKEDRQKTTYKKSAKHLFVNLKIKQPFHTLYTISMEYG